MSGSRIKQAVSVSLGSSDGDYTREMTLGGQRVRLARCGTDGDMERAKERIRDLDGVVDALGLGGIDVYLRVGAERYIIGDGLRLAQVAEKTPVVDGSGLKDTLERQVVAELLCEGLIRPEMSILLVSAMDRFGMAEAFVEAGCRCVFGDLMFNLGIDYPLATLEELEDLARRYRSRLLTTPFHLLYPTGAKQKERRSDPRFTRYFEEADIIAGDRHLILRHLPERIPGKAVLTNTTRPDTLEEFARAGVSWAATTTPEMDGVSGGTNMIEAAMVAVMEKAPAEITRADYEEWIRRLGLHGAVHPLNTTAAPERGDPEECQQ